MAEEKKISKKVLSKAFHTWYYGHLTCFSQEHMQTFGFLCTMLPIVQSSSGQIHEDIHCLLQY